jgi:hypothetical protein
MDFYIGNLILAANYKPVWTCWNRKTVSADVKAHKRRARRTYKHYLKTGCINDYNRSQKLMTTWDFD